jgi:para-aminobenzoate synthetase component 1
VPGWILALSYDLGRDLEPAAQHTAPDRSPSPWPRIHRQRVHAAYRYDHATREWSVEGDASTLPELDPGSLHAAEPFEVGATFEVGELVSNPGRAGYLKAARRVLDYIRAGDIYQANLAHKLTAPFTGSARALFAQLAESADPWHGAYLEADLQSGTASHRLAWCSASPELFLDYNPQTRTITTRPMKGTQPIGEDPSRLERSEKDQAELAMIVDLMRNDLGRVATFGSVRVTTPRALEHHADSVRHTTATVQATLRDGLGPADLIAACFPAGSITGAPKVRAMQIIDELESGGPGGRGPWCGSLGFLGDDGRLSLSVAIRTATIQGPPATNTPTAIPLGSFDSATLTYWAGAGLVADSVPEREWDETRLKAEVLTRVLEANALKPTGAHA